MLPLSRGSLVFGVGHLNSVGKFNSVGCSGGAHDPELDRHARRDGFGWVVFVFAEDQ